MKLLNTSNTKKQIKAFTIRCINELFRDVSANDPEKEAEQQIEAYVYSITKALANVMVLWCLTSFGEVIKINIHYGTTIIQMRLEL